MFENNKTLCFRVILLCFLSFILIYILSTFVSDKTNFYETTYQETSVDGSV